MPTAHRSTAPLRKAVRPLLASLLVSTGCAGMALPPTTTGLNLPQAARLDASETQLGTGLGGDMLMGIEARRLHISEGTTLDYGLAVTPFHTSADVGFWEPRPSGKSHVRLGLRGGVGQSALTYAQISQEDVLGTPESDADTPDADTADAEPSPSDDLGGAYLMPYAGVSAHWQRRLGDGTGKTAWTFTHGIGVSRHFSAGYTSLQPILNPNMDLSFRADLGNHRRVKGFFALGTDIRRWAVPWFRLGGGVRF